MVIALRIKSWNKKRATNSLYTLQIFTKICRDLQGNFNHYGENLLGKPYKFFGEKGNTGWNSSQSTWILQGWKNDTGNPCNSFVKNIYSVAAK